MAGVIKWELNDNQPYFRKSEPFARSDVSYSDNTKMTGVVERLSATMLKAVQDQFHNLIRQEHLQELAAAKTEELFLEYKEIFIEKNIAKSKRILTIDSEAAVQKAYKAFAAKEPQLQRLASKAAWREVLRSEIKDDELRFIFDAKSIIKAANVPENNMNRLFEDVKKVQKKFNQWTEKVFDSKNGTIGEDTINATLFPVSVLRRRGTGFRNEIEVKVEKDLIHNVLFLDKNFLKYHLLIFVKLEKANTSRLFETLIESLSPQYRGKPIELEYLQKHFGVSYSSLSDFFRKVIAPAVKNVNDALGTTISTKKIKDGRVLRWVQFVISERDEKILKGEKAIGDFVDVTERETFGYYIALLEFHKEQLERVDIIDRSLELNDLFEKDEAAIERYRGLYAYYRENLDDFEKLIGMSEQNKLPKGFEIDYELMIVYNDHHKMLGTTASLCLEALEILQSPSTTPQSNVLPGMEPLISNSGDTITAYLPFTFFISAKRKEIITDENYKTFEKRIKAAIKFGDQEQFEFNSIEKKERFIINIMKRDPKVIEVEPIEPMVSPASSAMIPSPQDYGSIFLESIRREYQEFQKGNEAQWSALLLELQQESTYNEEEFYNLLIVVLDYLISNDDGRRFYLANIKEPDWLKARWSQICQKALFWNGTKKQINLPEGMSVFDLYEKQPDVN